MVLMPYNYLIDEEIRERTKISYRNSIIIIDEAHNIASCSEESASFDVNTQFLQATIEELKQLKNKCLATE
jgi:Rad3-related DNA helicase